MSKTISVIIPAYNLGHYLKELLDCLERQTLKPLEIIVINDGSTDNTQEVIDSFKSVTCYKTENHGVSSARNLGLSKAKGDYIAFLDGDDLIADTYLEKLVSLDADVAKCSYREFENNSREWIVSNNSVEYVDGKSFSFANTVWATLYRKSFLLKEAITFIDGENYAEDAPYCTLTNILCESYKETDEVLYFHRIRTSSAVSGIRSGSIKPFPPYKGIENAIIKFRQKQHSEIENDFFDFCILRILASYLTTLYLFKQYDGDFRKSLCNSVHSIIGDYFPNYKSNSYIYGKNKVRVLNQPLVIRLATSLMLWSYSRNCLYMFSSTTSKVLRIIGRYEA